MIEFIGAPGDVACRIRFLPRTAFKDKPVEALEKDLVYGHWCPVCKNVIQAYFLTDRPVNLWPYEETFFISTGEKTWGDVLNILPNHDSKPGHSQYISAFLRTASGQSAQHLVLKNHVLRYQGLNLDPKKNEYRFTEHDSGGHACAYTGVFSHREELMLKDLCLIWQYPEDQKAELKNYKFGKIADVWESVTRDPGHYPRFIEGLKGPCRLLPAHGRALPVLMFRREKLTEKDPPWNSISNLMKFAFYKKEQAAA